MTKGSLGGYDIYAPVYEDGSTTYNYEDDGTIIMLMEMLNYKGVETTVMVTTMLKMMMTRVLVVVEVMVLIFSMMVVNGDEETRYQFDFRVLYANAWHSPGGIHHCRPRILDKTRLEM